ncbi:Peptide methionine sulfoxide reductase [Mycena indigotica]|uniref:Peptide methionine sulfoxide reductase n=1 Tax=Mycena indigotica TaxID=2126181 RepID=A0A8H6SUX4_9AGAR|nr:Peptide methionine sulfoxide reductase [Mycena indigotica]KAF7306635.1 Peptide methionine sulfoxide reductase [Mycena indigotica]
MSTLSASRPMISSPLAGPTQNARAPPPQTRPYGGAFPTSRALRPFSTAANAGKKPVKIIQPPASQKDCFVLDLTQAELSRR